MRPTLSSDAWTTYLLWMLATIFLVVAVVGSFNVFIDPLGVFPSPRINGINSTKPHLDHHRELSRYEGARRLCADTGIFGNSRAEIGFDPQGSAMLSHGLSAYNHAIPGTGASTSYRQIIWLRSANCLPKTIFIGVEFFDFLGASASGVLPAPESVTPPKPDLRFIAESVFSVTGLRDSLTTLLLQRSRYPSTTTDRGFNPLLNYIPEVEQNGHYVLFRQRAEENARNWMRKPLRLKPENGGPSDDEAAIEAILSMAKQQASTVYIIIYPYHAQIRMMIERRGMGDLFAEWKRLIVAIAERQIQAGGDVQVWDFSGISPETSESIPIKNDRKTHLTYYWEAGHFKKELGELVIDRLLGKRSDFGIRLNSQNIGEWLVEDRKRVQAILATPSPLRQETDDVLAWAAGH